MIDLDLIEKNYKRFYPQLPPSLSYVLVYIENDKNSEINTDKQEKYDFNSRMLCIKNSSLYNNAYVEEYACKLAEMDHVISSYKIDDNWILEFQEDLGIFLLILKYF